MNAKNYPQLLNYYSLSSQSQNQRQLTESSLPHQKNQLHHLNPLQMAPNSFNGESNPNSYYANSFPNNPNNNRPFFIFTQMPNSLPPSNYNQVIFLQNQPNNNQFFMPVIRQENIGYVLLRNPDQNPNNLNFMQSQNFQHPNNSNSQSFYSSYENNNQNTNLYYSYFKRNTYSNDFQSGGS